MLNEIMASIHNFFEVKDGAHAGNWQIEGGIISLPFLSNDQYFKIDGSVFNDGVYKYNDEMALKDETFTGTITGLAVPPEFLTLVQEIQDWQEKNGASVSGPYTSESFGGYTYQKASTATGEAYTWQAAFSPRLRRWRKL